MTQQANYADTSVNHPVSVKSGSPEVIHQETMLEFLIQMVSRKWLIVKITGIYLIAGLVLCFLLPVRYTATTRIMPPRQSQSMAALLINQIGMGSLAQASGAGLLSDPNSIYVGLLRSRPVADEIIRKYELVHAYRVRDVTAARERLKESTAIQSEPSTMISISVSDRDKDRAAEIANSYTQQLRALSRSISFTEASRRRTFFEDQVQAQKEALLKSEANFEQVQQNKGLVHLDTQTGMLINNMALLRGQIAAKEVELNALRSYSTENNPDLQLAQRELAGLREQARQMENSRGGSGYSDLSLKDVPKAGLDYLRAQRDVQYQQAFFDVLLRQFEAAKLDEAKEAAVIEVVEPAIAPERKSSPRRALIMILSAILGVFSGVFAATFIYRLESGRKDPVEAAMLLRLRHATFTWNG